MQVKNKSCLNFGDAKFVFKLTLYFLLWAVLLVSLAFSHQLENLLNVTSLSFSAQVARADYRVHFIDVGQGDCILIELPDSKNLLIDSGPASSRRDLLRYITSLNIQTIDFFILTHTDSDHVGNAAVIFEKFDVLNVFIPKIYSTFDQEQGQAIENFKVVDTAVWRQTTQAIHSEECLLNIVYNFVGESIVGANYSIDFYAPFSDVIAALNDYSPFIMAELNGDKYFFTGDATSTAENRFLNHFSAKVQQGFFDCDVLKVGHHGSATSSRPVFLQALTPEYAVISVGLFNSYSHPRDEVTNNLSRCGCHLLRTDILGSIVMSGSNGEIFFQAGHDNLSDQTYEWRSFVVSGAVVLAGSAFLIFKKRKSIT